MWGLQSGLALVLLHALTGFVVVTAGNTEPERPYYIRPSPAVLLTQPLDGTLSSGEPISLTCEVKGIEPIISGWWPHIYWRHNNSVVNSTWPGNITIDTNYWNVTTLHTSFPGTYQCVVDDGSFILASRLATVKEGCIGECTLPQWNSNFRMVCGQGHGVWAGASYSWYKDGLPLNSSSYLVEEEERIVVVTNETRDPFGLYTCIASGVIRQWYLPELASGENTTVLLDGNLMGNDVIVRHSGNGMTKEDITLQCNITVPRSTVSITWFHNGEQNHSLSTDSIHFPSNSHVSAIAGTYVCAASTSNWETRVQFRIFLKHKPNPPGQIRSSCNKEWPEINAQELHLSWNYRWWYELEPVNECKYYDKNPRNWPPPRQCQQVVVISRQNHSNEKCFIQATTFINDFSKTLQLDSAYCISLIATTQSQSESYFISQGNSTLHHCSGNGHSQPCQQVQYQEDDLKPIVQCDLISDETLSVKCEEPQSVEHGQVDCTFMWQQPEEAAHLDRSIKRMYERAIPHFNVTCPAGFTANSSTVMKNLLVATSQVSIPAALFDCSLVCEANMCARANGNEDCLYLRSASFTPHSPKLTEPVITCSTVKDVSNIRIEIPEDDKTRILKCSELDTSDTNSNITVTLFVNERMSVYSTQLSETIDINFTIGSEAKGNITVIVMYSNTATGTSKNSTAINIPGMCPCDSGWNGSQCDEAVCTLPCLNGGTCSQPDTCTCVEGWSGSTCAFPAPSPTPVFDSAAAYSMVAVGLVLLMLCSAVVIFLYYRYKRMPETSPLEVSWEPEYYLESVAECDTPTAYDDVDFDNLSQDLSNKSVKSEFKITPDPPYIVPEIKI